MTDNLVVINPQPLDRNPAAVYLAGLGNDESRRVQGQALRVIAEFLTGSPDVLVCNWAGLRFQHTAAIRARLAEHYAAKTANRLLSAMFNVLKAARKLGLMSDEDYRNAREIEKVKGSTLPAGRSPTGGEISALMAACEDDPTPAGARDAALIALAYSCGLRRAEVINLDLADYEPESGSLIVRHGKGNKARQAWLINGAARAIADWLTIRGSDPGALFHPIRKGGALVRRRLTPQAFYNLLIKRIQGAGIKDLSPHDLRRGFITDLLDAGADIATVAGMAGHASVTTTMIYDRRPEAVKKKAAGLLHVPYRGRLV